MTKAVPSTGERLAVIGVGTNNYSPTTPEERAARREVLAGLTAAGASVIDTAPAYRQSEEVIGELLADIGNRKQAFIATKVTADNGNLAQGVAMIEESKRRLKTDVLDLVQIHSLNGVDVLFPHLIDLKRKGEIRYVGITTSSGTQHGAMVELIKSQPLDFIQVDYSLANRAAAEACCRRRWSRRVGVLINLPFGGRRDGNLFSRVGGAGSAGVGGGDRRDELGPVLPEVRGVTSGRHGGDSGHDQGRASRGQPRRGARTHAGCGACARAWRSTGIRTSSLRSLQTPASLSLRGRFRQALLADAQVSAVSRSTM